MTITPEARTALKRALFHQISMWDALSQLESELECGDITSDDISCFAGNLNEPEDTHSVDDTDLDELLNGLQLSGTDDDQDEDEAQG